MGGCKDANAVYSHIIFDSLGGTVLFRQDRKPNEMERNNSPLLTQPTGTTVPTTEASPDDPGWISRQHVVGTARFARAADVNSVVLPHTRGLRDYPIVRNLYPSKKWVLMNKETASCQTCLMYDENTGDECVLDKFNGPFSVACEEALKACSNTNKDASAMHHYRTKLYYYMAILCLTPFEVNDVKELPLCVVKDIQLHFPDPCGMHLKTETRIYFSRSFSNSHHLEMEAQPLVYCFPYDNDLNAAHCIADV